MSNQYYKIKSDVRKGKDSIILWLHHIDLNIAYFYVLQSPSYIWKIGRLITVKKDFLYKHYDLITDLKEIKRLDKKRLLTGII